jgi:hypothetical protein
MLISHRWQSRTALLIALGMASTAAVPILMAAPATAGSEPDIVGQVLSQSESLTVPAGTVIRVSYDEAEKIVVTPDETAPITLTVAADIRSASGTILVPAGSQIQGNLRPARGGTRFVAQELKLRNRNQRLPIRANSRVITERETIKKGTDTGDILKGAAVGAAAAAAVSEIFGDIDVVEVLGGAGAGAIAGLLLGGRREAEVVVVNPETDLELTLRSDLRLN